MNPIIKRIVLIAAYMLAAGFGFIIASVVVLYLPDPAREARGLVTSKLLDDVMQSHPPDSSDTILFFVPSESNELFGMVTKADFLSVALSLAEHSPMVFCGSAMGPLILFWVLKRRHATTSTKAG